MSDTTQVSRSEWRTPWNETSVGLHGASGALRAAWTGETRLFEFVASLFLMVANSLPGLPAAFPARYIAMALLVAVATLRRPRWSLAPLNPYVWGAGALLAYYAVVSATGVQSAGASDGMQRLLRMVLLLVFVGATASGRLHLPSIIRGFAVGLVGNAVLFYLHIAPHSYQDFLTGYAGDKNASALEYAIGGLLLLVVLSTRRQQAAALAVFSILIFLTGSRTTLAGTAAAVMWFLFISRWPVAARLASGAGIIWLLQYVEENLSQVGIFAGRTGTDWFRAQIASAVSAKVAITPPQGMGLGEAYVMLPQGRFFFHNSYDTLFVEGGLVALIVVVGATVAICLRPLRTAPAAPRERIIEGATIALLVCSWQLGEVFLTVSWGLVVAAGMQAALISRGAHASLASEDPAAVAGAVSS